MRGLGMAKNIQVSGSNELIGSEASRFFTQRGTSKTPGVIS